MSSGDTRPLRHGELIGATLLVGMGALPHLWHLAIPVGLFFLLLLGLRGLALWRPGLAPGRMLLLLLTLGGAALVLTRYPMLFGKEAGSALLTVMAGLKLLEARRRRDLYVLVYMGLFILVTQFLFFQGMPILLHALAVTLGLIALLQEANRATPSATPWPALRRASRLLLQAAPLMLVLFVLFPRFSSPLWNLGPAGGSAQSGISDRLSPGSISRLARSREVAFRVTFDGPPPPPAQRYWRGRVIWFSDGFEWRADPEPTPLPGLLRAAPGAVRDSYQVTLEPFPGRWLYALDLPLTAPPDTMLAEGLQLLRDGPVKQRLGYRMVSARRLRPLTLSPTARAKGLQLPDNITPRMRRLAREWRRAAADSRGVVERALAFYREQPFFYTLYPPLLERNPADQFLFETRRGFCGHYATSFTLLMRLAGIPARVVVGYQGGEHNPLGDYLIVRQSDAHAWAEVWLEGKGWVRVDPTAAVAPQRIEQRLDPGLIAPEPGAPIDFVRLDPGPLGRLLHRIGLGMDAIDTGWRRWVIGYSRERQEALMRMLGLDFLRGVNLALGMVAAAAVVVALLALLLLRRQGEAPLLRDYHRFCRRLARIGLPRRPHEGPRDYAERVAAARPDLASQVDAIARLYIGLRYGRAGNDRAGRHRLRRLVRRFRPRRRG